MKYNRIFVALLAACIFVVPAFSMPNFENHMKDGNAQIDVPCQNPVAGDQPEFQQPCDCKKDNEGFGPRSMMDGKCDKPMMDNKAPCGKQAPKMDAPCQNPVAGDQPGFQQPCDCKKDNEGFGPRSMMGGKCDKPMMVSMHQNQCGQNDAKMGFDENNGPALHDGQYGSGMKLLKNHDARDHGEITSGKIVSN